jgi:hypothetical protein
VKVFHCDHCGNLIFFENTTCVACGRTLAYLPEAGTVGSLDPAPGDVWHSPAVPDASFRLCANYARQNVCNWAIDAADPHELCRSCRLTEIIPDVRDLAAHEAWYRLEVAKRRLLVTLMALALPVDDRRIDPQGGLAFQFKADPPSPEAGPPVLTGHNEGIITINIAEADDAERERRRKAMHEPYRTLLGHMRHEIGHYYWNRLVRRAPDLEPFRAVFGDERADYGEALRLHYETGAPADWQGRFVSAYASAHPWEDWAETWAHYLHMFDTIETAAACGVSLRPRRRDEPSLSKAPDPAAGQSVSFDRLIESWFPLTYMLNNLNRGLGQADAYPFVLSSAAISKLRFVHELIERSGHPSANDADVPATPA